MPVVFQKVQSSGKFTRNFTFVFICTCYSCISSFILVIMSDNKVDDLSLPAAVMVRLVKDALPDGVNISKEARSAISKAASVFVLYATTCANNAALAKKRKTLSANDVFEGLEEMEFDEFVPRLKEDLEAFRKEQKGKKEAAAESKRRKSEQQHDEESTPEAKKQKTDDNNDDSIEESVDDS